MAQLVVKNLQLLYQSAEENTLCLIVDLDITPLKESAEKIAENALILQLKIARMLDCVVKVLQNDFMSAAGRDSVAKNSVALPINPTSLPRLVSIFGDLAKCKINSIQDDEIYASNLEMSEMIYLPRNVKAKHR